MSLCVYGSVCNRVKDLLLFYQLTFLSRRIKNNDSQMVLFWGQELDSPFRVKITISFLLAVYNGNLSD